LENLLSTEKAIFKGEKREEGAERTVIAISLGNF